MAQRRLGTQTRSRGDKKVGPGSKEGRVWRLSLEPIYKEPLHEGDTDHRPLFAELGMPADLTGMSYRIILREVANTEPPRRWDRDILLPSSLRYQDYYLELIGRTISQPLISRSRAVIGTLKDASASMNPSQQRIADEDIGMEQTLMKLAGEFGAECNDYDRSPTRTKHHERCFYIDLADLNESAELSELVGANALIHRGGQVSAFEPRVEISLDRPSAVRISERYLLRVWRARIKSDSAAIFYERRWHPDGGLTWGYLSGEEIEPPREKREIEQASKARLLLGILNRVAIGGRPAGHQLDLVDDITLLEIVAALIHDHAERGHPRPTVHDLAATLGVDRSTMYRRLTGFLPWTAILEKGQRTLEAIPTAKRPAFVAHMLNEGLIQGAKLQMIKK